jgi:hypothetical protein
VTALGSLARIEVRHLARSPLLWLGVVLAVALAALELVSFWPVLAGDDLVAYRDGFVVAGGALLAGAWVALRDRTTGAGDLLAVTPTAPWRLWRARLAGIAVVAAGAFTAVFAAGLAFSAARGGRGMPDLRLLADGALAAALGGWVGVAVGRLGSRVVPLLVAPLLVGCSLLIASLPGVTDRRLSVQRLSPVLSFEDRSAVFGFLPDAFWPHLGYLAGLLLLGGALLLAVPAIGSAQRPSLRSVLAVSLAGLVLVVASGARLVALPDRELVVGPAPSARLAVGFRFEGLPASLGPSFAYPDDGLARSCAGDAAMSVCVYPGYGRRLASFARQAMQPVVGLLAGLPGVPTRARMVPVVSQGSDVAACADREVQLTESLGRFTPSGPARNAEAMVPFATAYLRCALGGAVAVDDAYLDHEAPSARDAVNLWALLAGGLVTRQQVLWALQTGGATFLLPSPASVKAAMAMADLPAARVRAELGPVWERLRAGTLPASELPGQRP